MSDASRQLDLTNEVKAPESAPRLGSQFDAFLFSPIGEDRNGMPLSVVSLLARRDIDPWQEAATLAAMSVDAASRRLDSLIRTLPAQPLTLPDSRTIATRLIALLPHWTDPKIRSAEKQANAAGTRAVPRRRRTMVVAMILAISMMLLMGAQLAMLYNEPPTQPVATDAPPAPSPVIRSQTHPPAPEK
jgi:hypothetical protein